MATQTQDEDTLAQIGYKQELNRDWSMLHNFGISFSVIVCGLDIEVGVRFVQRSFIYKPLLQFLRRLAFLPSFRSQQEMLVFDLLGFHHGALG
jgi:hypothetical protein